ncbi:PREDICTED: fibrinogen-like protein A [Drosophila arizonae]|uniref:Fibrinogen-like protein A n=1 Tax=Drosophila arizonae TaxID=7263 RepID=A0ABM1PZ70_DROAR|nr:PREDICTED: fibrinogen-like protein A [Drosophila arizonae]
MTLEALVTALTCLSTPSTTLPGNFVTNIMVDSTQPFRNHTLGCPAVVLDALMARVHYMSAELQSLHADLTEVQQLIDEYKSQAPVQPIESRMQQFQPVAPSVACKVDDTPRNCIGQKHGPVRIRISPDMEPFYVICDQEKHDGGWLVVAHRFDGSEDFYRDWRTYKTGFGSLNSEFFIGLDKLYRLTISDTHELLIIMKNEMGEYFANYDQFSIGSEDEKYFLYVLGSYKGNAGNALQHHSGKKFTTYDQDNDDNGQNCASIHMGAWWYGRDCIKSNLFGTFQKRYGQQIDYYKGILWNHIQPGPKGSLRYVRILIRPYKQS